jgi:hypothetical protein
MDEGVPKVRGRIGRLDSTSGRAAAQVSGADYVGGLVGAAVYADVYESSSVGSVTATGSLVGGLVGSIDAFNGEKLYSSSTVNGVTGVGGLIGVVGDLLGQDNTLSHVGATGDVTATGDSVGGLIGYAKGLTLSAGYAMGDVTAYANVGGLMGQIVNSAASESFATGDVISNGGSAGGLVGYSDNSDLENTYATGYITSSGNTAGGLVGRAEDSTIDHSYTTSQITLLGTAQDAGALVGSAEEVDILNTRWELASNGTLLQSVGDKDMLPKLTEVNIAGFSSTDLKKESSFTPLESDEQSEAWSIDALGAEGKVWRIYEGYTTPLLRVFMQDSMIAQKQTSEYNGQVVEPYRSYPQSSSPVSYEADASGFAYVIYAETPPVRDFAGTLVGEKDAGTYGYDVFSTQFGRNYQVYDYDAETPVLVSTNGLTWEITKRPLSITGLTADNKVYDATTDATYSGTVSVDTSNIVVTGSWEDAYWNLSSEERAEYDLANREVVTVSEGTLSLAFEDKNVGNDKQLVVTGLSLEGGDAHNYALVASGVTADITKANLTVTGLTAQDKVYNRLTTATLGGTAAVTALGRDRKSVV